MPWLTTMGLGRLAKETKQVIFATPQATSNTNEFTGQKHSARIWCQDEGYDKASLHNSALHHVGLAQVWQKNTAYLEFDLLRSR